MKKILLFILIVVSINGLAQTGFPGQQSMANASTRLIVNGGLQATRGLINGVFTDTTAANSDYIDFYNGAQIYTRSDRNFWLRDSILNMWIRMAKYNELGGGQRFGVSGEDNSPTQNRLVDFTSTYDFSLNHIRFLGFIADSSASSVSYANLGLSRAQSSTFLGSIPRVSGVDGVRGAFFSSNWNTGNAYSQIAGSPNGTANTINYFRAYSDSLSAWLLAGSKYKVHNLPSGIGTKAIRYDPSNGEFTYADTTIGGGGGEANTASNVGTGSGVFKQKTLVDLEFRSIIGASGILATQNTNDVTIKADTTTGNAGALSSKDYTQFIIDSLAATGWGSGIQHESTYSIKDELTGMYMVMFDPVQSGAGASTTYMQTSTNQPPAGWIGGVTMATGTTSTGRSLIFSTVSLDGNYSGVSVSATERFNCGFKIRAEDVSDGTDTYEWVVGVSDDANGTSGITNGIGFRYTSTDSSGTIICWTESGGTRTEDATDITFAADTDYKLEFTKAPGGAVTFYVNKAAKSTISTNIPTPTQYVNPSAVIKKLAGTTSRALYVDWGAIGVQTF